MNITHDELIAICRAFAESNAQTVRRAMDGFSHAAQSVWTSKCEWKLPRFLDNGDGTITDTMTGLVWTKENVGSGKMDCAAAEKACKELTLGGRKWDFPSRAELLTLVDDTRYNPAIDTAMFPNCAPDWYWTKTEHPADKSCVFIVYFGYGGVADASRGGKAFLRAVSRAPAGQ